MTGSLPFPLDREGVELAQHVDFVRRLARGLAADTAASEDLAQETWLATFERGQAPTGSLRSWLARVLRNRAALALRRGERRVRREEARAQGEASAPTAELVERMELHGRIVAAVLALPPDYREVILLHYFEDEDTSSIARRLGIPEATVRTRLARARKRLRQPLEAHFGDARGLFLALASVARGSGAAAPASLSLLDRLVLSLAMKKALIVASLALLVWLVLRSSPTRVTPGEPPQPESSRTSALAAAPAPVAEVAEPSETRTSERAPVEVAPRPAEAPQTAPDPAPAVLATAEPKTAWLEFHVHDRQGRVVPDARVQVNCYRTREDPGSSHSLEDMPSATTDAHGIARLEYPRRLDAWTGPERPEIGAVCYTVEHPDFVSVEEWSFKVEASPAEVVLRHGALLIVAGFVGNPTQLLSDVEPHLSDEVKAIAADWTPVRDGRPSCNRLPPGRHALWLTRPGEGGTWASAVTEFELAEEEVRELTLELHAPRTLIGRLDAEVPRPIQHGEVLLNMMVGGPGLAPRGIRLFHADVDADGSFDIAGLPPGMGEMIGMCDGWVSRQPPADLAPGEPVPVYRAPVLQKLDPSLGEPFVLGMEPTARLELDVFGPGDEPVEGASIQMWPNVVWSCGYASIFLDRQWIAATDAQGHAVVENLPAGQESLAVIHPKFCLPAVTAAWGGPPRRQAEAKLVAGETTELELRLEPRGDEER